MNVVLYKCTLVKFIFIATLRIYLKPYYLSKNPIYTNNTFIEISIILNDIILSHVLKFQ